MKNSIIIGLLIMLLPGCKSTDMLTTVSRLDLNRYQGTWYEIARLPNSFEGGLTSVTASYSLKENGQIKVINQGYKSDKKLKSITGVAWVPDDKFPGRLKVRFFWPFSGKYYVIHVDDEYQYALVGSPSRRFLWILAKQPEISEEVFSQFLEIARKERFSVEELIKVDQSLHIDD